MKLKLLDITNMLQISIMWTSHLILVSQFERVEGCVMADHLDVGDEGAREFDSL
jgi:hypothetical protein